MAYRLVFWCYRARLEVIIYKIKMRIIVTSVDGAIPPVEYNIVYKTKIAIHAYRRIACDIIGPKVSHKCTVQATNGASKCVIISIESFGKNTVLNGNVYRWQFYIFTGTIINVPVN